MEVFRSLWDVWQLMCAAEVCVSWRSYLKFHRDRKNANQQKNFAELCGTMKKHNKKTTVLFVSNTHVHGATLCSQSAQLHNCRFVSPAASCSSAWSHHQNSMEKFYHPLTFFSTHVSKFLRNVGNSPQPQKQSEASALNKPVVLQVVLIRDPSTILFFSSCHSTSTSVCFFLTLPGFQ